MQQAGGLPSPNDIGEMEALGFGQVKGGIHGGNYMVWSTSHVPNMNAMTTRFDALGMRHHDLETFRTTSLENHDIP